MGCLLAGLIVLSPFTPTAQADYAAGVEAENAGDKNLARRIWRRSAWRQNDLLSQIKLGEIYKAGDVRTGGLPRDDVESQQEIEALVWYYMASVNADQYELGLEQFIRRRDDARREARELLLRMGQNEVGIAHDRITYISWCRGASGLLRLARVYRSTLFDLADPPEYGTRERTTTAGTGGRQQRRIIRRRDGEDTQQTIPYIPRPDLSPKFIDILTFFYIAENDGLGAIAKEEREDFEQRLVDLLSQQYETLNEAEAKVAELSLAAEENAEYWVPPYEIYADSEIYGPNELWDECQRDDPEMNTFVDTSRLDVRYIQYALQVIGALGPDSRADNEMGPTTRRAIARFQEENGFQPTGDLTLTQTRYLIRLAAIRGHTLSQNVLGVMYAKCIGVPFDEIRAKYWFEQAHSGRLAVAAHNLRVLYHPGDQGRDNNQARKCYYGPRTVKDDAQEAERWRDEAAKLGYKPAQQELLYLFRQQ